MDMDCPFCPEACTCVADDSTVPDTESEASSYSAYDDDEYMDFSLISSSSEED